MRYVVVALLTAAFAILPLAGRGQPQLEQGSAGGIQDGDSESIRVAGFAEPLVRAGATTPTEDSALSNALSTYRARIVPGDLNSLTAFLAHYPRSGWAPAIYTNLGFAYLHDGYFSMAINAWKQAWALGKRADDPRAKAVVDRAVGELAQLYASLGQMQNLSDLFDEMGDRPIAGSATELIQQAHEQLALVNKDPRHLFNCGPIALRLMILSRDARNRQADALQYYRAGPNGTTLAELRQLAGKAKFASRVVYRQPGQAVPVPSIVHWKVGHYGAILGHANGRFHVQDPVFAGDGLWAKDKALDAEASGYFLVPADTPLQPGWRVVPEGEAESIWGKGPTSAMQPGDANDPTANNGPNGCNSPMCGYDIKEATVGVTLSDTPVGYVPPIGASMKVKVTYNQREDSQPANFSFFNVGQK
jgi:tetratricopeptide (TPR) repeat protein